MIFKRASTALEKLHLRKSPTQSNTDTTSNTAATVDAKLTDQIDAITEPGDVSPQTKLTPTASSDALAGSPVHDSSVGLEAASPSLTTSPTDPSYVPNQLGSGGWFSQSQKPPRAILRTPTRSLDLIERSFFDSDTGSEDDEPVVGRASSVRISKPNIVKRSSTVQGQTLRPLGVYVDVQDRSTFPMDSRISESSESTFLGPDVADRGTKQNGPSAALKALEGQDVETESSAEFTSEISKDFISIESVLREEASRDGLHLNPITDRDRISIQRAISAPPLPHRHPSHKKVKIRPSDLIVNHSKNGSKQFRESVVTTPYPSAKDVDRDTFEDDEKAELDEKVSDLPQRSGTIKSARFASDRFPSPDRPEVLFIDLCLANHPSATTTLEIKIANKSVYDDEMLFRQIRAAYRSRLLGMSRSVFCLIRGVAYATVSPSVEHDFRTTEFMKHFRNPQIGRKRKTWVIWLRHHSRQQSPTRGDHLSIVKRPLSASLRTADKRLSVTSDSTSTFNFSFLPPLVVPRILFLNKEPGTPSSASTYRSPPAFGLEDGSGTIKVELHHEFSFWTLALAYSCVLSLSIAAVVLWTIFGVPGARPGEEVSMLPAALLADRLAWTTAAQTRVLTGLVLGVTVALLGSMVEICLIAGAYTLL